MALVPGLPAPLPKWTKFLIRLGEAAGYVLLESLVDESTHADSREDLEWRRLVLQVTRTTPSGTEEDFAHCNFDIVNITGGQVDTSWIGTDFTTIEAFFDSWWDGIASLIDSSHTLSAYKWYRMRFREVMTPTHRFEDTGPPVRLQLKTKAGTWVGTPLPYQVAMSVTEKTGVPKHWGRFYMPGLGTNAIEAAHGRWTSVAYTTMADATAELYDDLAGADMFPVVPVTQVNKVLTGGLLGVNEIVVDDIPDVIRRRRPRQAAVRRTGVPSP